MTLYYVSLSLEATAKLTRTQGSAKENVVPRTDDESFRSALGEVLAQSGLSMRGFSAAMGRDPGYVAALMDPTRPSRARPTPADLVRASDATGIAVVDLLESLWGIERTRLADELMSLGIGGPAGLGLDTLSDVERHEVADFAAFITARRRGRKGNGGR
jgi:hypothetical protein